MPASGVRYFEFGGFHLDAHRRVLSKNGSVVHLTPRAFDLLHVLVDNAGRILEHDELLDKVWEGTFVEQGNLKKAVSNLRHALGESPESSEFIVTVPRRGYRFAAAVRPIADETILIRETRAEIVVEEETEEQPSPKTLAGQRISKRPKIAIAIGTGLLLIVAAFAALRIWRADPPRFSASDIKTTRLMSQSNITGGRLSPDGNYFCYSRSEGYDQSLSIVQVVTGSAVQIVAPVRGSFWEIGFAPDSSYVYYTLNSREDAERSGVYRVPALGGASELIIKEPHLGVKVSPDGKRVMMIRTVPSGPFDTHELFTVSAEGGDQRVVAALPLHSLFRGAAWSPDSSSIVYAVKKQLPNEKPSYYVAEIGAGGGTESVLMPEQESPVVLNEWLPDKQSFIFQTREPNSESFQLRQYFPATAETLRVTNDDFSYSQFSASADGKTLGGIRGYGLASIWTRDGEGESEQVAVGSFFAIDWTADGHLVFSTTENTKEFVGIMDAAGKNRRLLTRGDDGIRQYPRVSGDGRHITFASDRTGSRQIWQMDLGGREQRQMTTDIVALGSGMVLADGQTVIYDAYTKNVTWSLFRQNADGSTLTLNGIDTLDWSLSPDERLLALYFTDPQTKKKRLVIREFETGREVKSFDISTVYLMRWTPDGKALAYVRHGEDIDEIVLLPLAGSPERIAASVRGEKIANFAWSADGSRLAIVRNKVQFEAVLIRG
jgi:DNA-binding winged helix-turn-helix (wHTH) protein/Tol biopolymer transport system component